MLILPSLVKISWLWACQFGCPLCLALLKEDNLCLFYKKLSNFKWDSRKAFEKLYSRYNFSMTDFARLLEYQRNTRWQKSIKEVSVLVWPVLWLALSSWTRPPGCPVSRANSTQITRDIDQEARKEKDIFPKDTSSSMLPYGYGKLPPPCKSLNNTLEKKQERGGGSWRNWAF